MFDIFSGMNKKNFMILLGKIIKYYRQKAGLTQEQLDEKIESDGKIQRYELGKNRVTITMLKRIGEVLDVNLVDILVNIKNIDDETLNKLRSLTENNMGI